MSTDHVAELMRAEIKSLEFRIDAHKDEIERLEARKASEQKDFESTTAKRDALAVFLAEREGKA